MLDFHIHFDQGYSNVENRTAKKIQCSAFSVISVYDQKQTHQLFTYFRLIYVMDKWAPVDMVDVEV